jgi:hypothetical protein
MITKENAERKICPIMAHCVNPNQTYDSNFAVLEYQSCMTTCCMAWRVDEYDSESGNCKLLK